MAKEAYARFNFDEIWFLVSPHNPLKEKNNLEDFSERFEQCKILTKDYPWCHVSRFEQDEHLNITADTLAALKRKYPETNFVWLMGSENWCFFHKWQRYEEILKTTPIISFYREDDDEDYSNHPALKAFQAYRCAEDAEISSAPQWRVIHMEPHKGRASDIRKALKGGQVSDDLTNAQKSHIKRRKTFCLST